MLTCHSPRGRTLLSLLSACAVFEIKGQSQTKSRAPTRNRIRAFDGTTTRLYDREAVGNVIAGPQPDDHAVRPHMMLMRYSLHRIPLSTLLQGDEAIAKHPFGKPSAILRHEIRYEGEDKYQGLRCQIVSVASVRKADGQATSRRHYWLAEERNWIPVRLVNYRHSSSQQVPSGEGIVEEFREIKPGVWFPMVARTTVYDTLYLQREGKQRLQWREDYVTETVSLEPKYDTAYFQDVKFPDGTAVYKVENGQIVQSWRPGAPEAPGGPTANTGMRRWLMVGVGLAVLLALVAFAWTRRSAPKATTADGGTPVPPGDAPSAPPQ
jgi:hypothetical protein